jgi:hypothetical protein
MQKVKIVSFFSLIPTTRKKKKLSLLFASCCVSWVHIVTRSRYDINALTEWIHSTPWGKNEITVTYPRKQVKIIWKIITLSWIVNNSITENPGRRTTYNTGQNTKTTQNFTLNDKRILNTFKFWKTLKLEKISQLRVGCMYYTLVTSSTNMNPYKDSSITRDVFDETAWIWSQMWTESCKNQCEQFDWFIFTVVLTTTKQWLWFNSGHFRPITVPVAEGAGPRTNVSGLYSRDARLQSREEHRLSRLRFLTAVLSSSRHMSGLYLRFGHCRFHLLPFQFIIY